MMLTDLFATVFTFSRSAIYPGMTMLMRILVLMIFGVCMVPMQGEAVVGPPQEAERAKHGQANQKRKPLSLPESVLKSLRANFEKLEPDMADDEIFRTLGLCEYQKDLRANSRFMADGAGGNWRYFIDDQNGYSVAFRSFWGRNSECWLQVPGETVAGGVIRTWRMKRVNAKPVEATIMERDAPMEMNQRTTSR